MFFEPIHERPSDVSIYLHSSMLSLLEPVLGLAILSHSPRRESTSDPSARTGRDEPIHVAQPSVGRLGRDRGGRPRPSPEALYLPEIAHPRDGVMVYKVVYGDKAVVYASDVELAQDGVMEVLQAFAHGAQRMLVCDVDLTDDEYEAYRGWGHSNLQMAVDLARRGKVERLVLFHHAPNRDDSAMESLEKEACRGLRGRLRPGTGFA